MSISIPGKRLGLKNVYSSMPDEVRSFFVDLPALIDSKFSLDIALAYMFFRIELGQRQMLYYGARKLHRTETQLTWKAIDLHHFTRKEIKDKFKTIYGFRISNTADQYIADAEKVRDKLMHGIKPTEKELREAICRAMYYVKEINELVAKKYDFYPISGYQRGISGRSKPLDKSTTKWILMGMGFDKIS